MHVPKQQPGLSPARDTTLEAGYIQVPLDLFGMKEGWNVPITEIWGKASRIDPY
jgi:hypothetical protein